MEFGMGREYRVVLKTFEVGPRQQVLHWRVKRDNRNAEGWELAQTVRDSMYRLICKSEPLDSLEGPLAGTFEETVSKSHRRVEIAIQRAFREWRGLAWRAASEYLFYAVDSSGDFCEGNARGACFVEHRAELAKVGLTPREAVDRVMGLIEPYETTLQLRERVVRRAG
jgi:hypothetical protein